MIVVQAEGPVVDRDRAWSVMASIVGGGERYDVFSRGAFDREVRAEVGARTNAERGSGAGDVAVVQLKAARPYDLVGVGRWLTGGGDNRRFFGGPIRRVARFYRIGIDR